MRSARCGAGAAATWLKEWRCVAVSAAAPAVRPGRWPQQRRRGQAMEAVSVVQVAS